MKLNSRVLFPAASLLFAMLYLLELQHRHAAEERVRHLEGRLAILMAPTLLDLAPPPQSTQGVAATPSPSPSPVAAVVSQPSREEGGVAPPDREGAEWRAEQRVREIARFVSVDPTQRARLKEIFATKADQPFGASPTLPPDVEAVLGPAGVAQYHELRALEVQEERRQRIEREAIILSRKLRLGEEQEARVHQVLQEADTALAPRREEIETKAREIMTQHFKDASPKDALRTGYEEMRELREGLEEEERKLRAERFKEILSPEQYELWISSEAQQS